MGAYRRPTYRGLSHGMITTNADLINGDILTFLEENGASAKLAARAA